jgi:hypothetical protein
MVSDNILKGGIMFGKKKQAKPVPINEIIDMRSAGMGDKDIIKNLKKRGYSYDEIEKGMLDSLKQGVDMNPMMQPQRPQAQQPQQYEDFSGVGDVFGQQQVDSMRDDLGLTEVDFQQAEDANIIIEELVEGVVQEKMGRLEEKIKGLEDTLARYNNDIKQVEKKADESPGVQSKIKDYDMRISEIAEQMEDLQVRIGGVEKAFKQFLPSLTTNIQSLSEMIHELKQKQQEKEGYNYHKHEHEMRA